MPETNSSFLFLRILKLVVGTAFRIYFRLNCQEENNASGKLAKEERPTIIVFNHTSHLDVVVVSLCLDINLVHRIRYPSKKELSEDPKTGWLMRLAGAVPIDRDMMDLSAARSILQLLQSGKCIIISPEGTRSTTGAVGQFTIGFSKLAVKSKALILPVGIAGTYEAFPKGARFPKPKNVCVSVGSPIDTVDVLGDRPGNQALEDFAEQVRRQVALLAGQPTPS
jgi:1-acyl-sn-glycerol-3-phosphate acyltransferase